MSPRVSVVVPLHNGEQFVREALGSIVSQTHTDIELIVVDDGSTDGSAALVAETLAPMPHAVLLRQDNAGVSAARNAGLANASGPQVAFCDQDDMWEPQKLQRQVAYLDEHPEIDVVLVRQEPFLDQVDAAPAWLKPDRVFGDLGGVLPCTGLYRRDAFERVGFFEEDRFADDDLNWLLRARRLGVGIGLLSEVLVRRRVHAANATHDVGLLRASLFRSLRGFVRESRESE